jgi:hypothetical protein
MVPTWMLLAPMTREGVASIWLQTHFGWMIVLTTRLPFVKGGCAHAAYPRCCTTVYRKCAITLEEVDAKDLAVFEVSHALIVADAQVKKLHIMACPSVMLRSNRMVK